jgi:hypothetical protein
MLFFALTRTGRQLSDSGRTYTTRFHSLLDPYSNKKSLLKNISRDVILRGTTLIINIRMLISHSA